MVQENAEFKAIEKKRKRLKKGDNMENHIHTIKSLSLSGNEIVTTKDNICSFCYEKSEKDADCDPKKCFDLLCSYSYNKAIDGVLWL